MIYTIPQGDDITRITFNRKLFEYNLQSHKGKYQKRSKGILTNYEKPVRSCVIFDKEQLEQVKKLTKKLQITTKFYEINEL
jgi:CMP-2-keto-3-deoxyoctulosonic acid synthetase